MSEATAGTFEEALRRAARLVLLSYLAAFLGIIALIIFAAIAFLGFMAVTGIEAGIRESVRGIGAAAQDLSLGAAIVLLLAGIAAYAIFLVSAYLYYKAYSGLRQALPSAPDHVRASLDLPVTILYITSILYLAGVALSIILVGFLLIGVASLTGMIGNLLLGLSLRNIGAGLETAGTILAAAAVLRILGILPYLGGLLAMVGFVLEITAFYMIYTWRGSFQLESPGETAAPTTAQ